MTNVKKILSAAAVASTMLITSTANAALIVKIDELTDVSGPITVADNSVTDTSGAVGHITFNANTTNFNIISTISFGSVPLTFPDLLDLTVSASSTGAGILEVSLTETDFSGFVGAGLEGGGTLPLGSSGMFELYVGSTNMAFEESQLIASGSFGSGAYSIDTGTNDLSPFTSGNFSLTLKSTLTADSAGDFFSVDTKAIGTEFLTSVPSPSIFALFGAALFGLGMARRSKK